jgi:hypothetical protein
VISDLSFALSEKYAAYHCDSELLQVPRPVLLKLRQLEGMA